MPRYANVDKLMEHAIRLDWSVLKWVNEVDISTAINPNVVERKKGKWIKMSDADGIYWTCSECGEDIPRVSHFDPQFDLFPRLESIEKTNFCPNCGADMRKETENGKSI